MILAELLSRAKQWIGIKELLKAEAKHNNFLTTSIVYIFCMDHSLSCLHFTYILFYFRWVIRLWFIDERAKSPKVAMASSLRSLSLCSRHFGDFYKTATRQSKVTNSHVLLWANSHINTCECLKRGTKKAHSVSKQTHTAHNRWKVESNGAD